MSDNGKVMMHVDMEGDCPVTYFTMDFHRAIRSISFDAYKDPMRNECALFLQGRDGNGNLNYDDYLYGVETNEEWTKTFTFTFDSVNINSFTFKFDPANDPVSYWRSKEKIYLDNFVVEFK